MPIFQQNNLDIYKNYIIVYLMKYKTFDVSEYLIDVEINKLIAGGWEFVQVITSANGIASSKHKILMRISKENDDADKLADTIRKTINSIKSDPTNIINVELTKILGNLKDELSKA